MCRCSRYTTICAIDILLCNSKYMMATTILGWLNINYLFYFADED